MNINIVLKKIKKKYYTVGWAKNLMLMKYKYITIWLEYSLNNF